MLFLPAGVDPSGPGRPRSPRLCLGRERLGHGASNGAVGLPSHNCSSPRPAVLVTCGTVASHGRGQPISEPWVIAGSAFCQPPVALVLCGWRALARHRCYPVVPPPRTPVQFRSLAALAAAGALFIVRHLLGSRFSQSQRELLATCSPIASSRARHPVLVALSLAQRRRPRCSLSL